MKNKQITVGRSETALNPKERKFFQYWIKDNPFGWPHYVFLDEYGKRNGINQEEIDRLILLYFRISGIAYGEKDEFTEGTSEKLVFGLYEEIKSLERKHKISDYRRRLNGEAKHISLKKGISAVGEAVRNGKKLVVIAGKYGMGKSTFYKEVIARNNLTKKDFIGFDAGNGEKEPPVSNLDLLMQRFKKPVLYAGTEFDFSLLSNPDVEIFHLHAPVNVWIDRVVGRNNCKYSYLENIVVNKKMSREVESAIHRVIDFQKAFCRNIIDNF